MYAGRASRDLSEKLSLKVDGVPAHLMLARASAELTRGRGGLDVLRVESTFVADLSSPGSSISYRDDNFSGRVGWREIIAYAVGGQTVAASSVPSTSLTRGLRDYPGAGLGSPSDVIEATVEVSPHAPRAPGEEQEEWGEVGSPDPFASAFSGLIEHDLSVGALAFALIVAMGAGALHALGPGHGKSVMAAYLVSADGRPRHAAAVGVAISLMHTASVIALGLVTLWASRTFPPERVYPYLSLISGAVVLGLGAWLLRTRLRGSSTGDDHPHEHVHAHGGGMVHHHGPRPHAGLSPLSWRGLGVLAISGGLLPSPTALVVLLGAVALGRVAFGLTLVGAFSIGLASALTVLGMFVLKARGFAEQRLGSRPAALLPILSAGAVCLLGMFLTTRAIVGL